MNTRRTLAATAVLALATLTLPAPAQADPTFMTSDEFAQVTEGMTKGKVETICACLGTKTGYTVSHNGNTYTAWEYLSHVGTAYIMYRVGADGLKHVGDYKAWCVSPYGDLGQPEGGCGFTYFS